MTQTLKQYLQERITGKYSEGDSLDDALNAICSKDTNDSDEYRINSAALIAALKNRDMRREDFKLISKSPLTEKDILPKIHDYFISQGYIRYGRCQTEFKFYKKEREVLGPMITLDGTRKVCNVSVNYICKINENQAQVR